MVSEGAQPSGIDLVRPEPRPGIPTQLQASVVLWLFAIAAGLFETAAETVVATDSGRCCLGQSGGAPRGVIAALVLRFHPAANPYIRAPHGFARGTGRGQDTGGGTAR
jgi:hypothetical protein